MTLEFQNSISIQPIEEGGGGGGGSSSAGIGGMIPQNVEFSGLILEAKGENQ